MEPTSPSVYSTVGFRRSALQSRVSVLLSLPSPPSAPSRVSTRASNRTPRTSRKPRLVLATRPAYRASAFRSSDTRPPSSTRSVIDSTAPQVRRILRPAPRIISPVSAPINSSRFENLYASPLTPLQDSGHTSPIAASDDHRCLSRRSRNRKRDWSKLLRKGSFKKNRVRTKAILSAVFGFALVLTLGIYLTLAATRIGSGVMFHVIFIVFILALTAVFCHSLLMMCLLILGPAKPKRTSNRRQESTNIPVDQQPIDDLLPEKPIPIVMAIDEEADIGLTGETVTEPNKIRAPPPVYGIWRGSSRMNPNLVHWQKLPPSPLTPTYDEAMRDAQNAVGYRPPSYISEGGGHVRPAVEGRPESRDCLMDSIHPLERERLVGLIGQAR